MMDPTGPERPFPLLAGSEGADRIRTGVSAPSTDPGGTKPELIGLACGHRVPRSGNAGYGLGYWCETCGTHRLSGRVGTGERSHEWLWLLPVLVGGLEVDFHGLELDDSQLALIEALNARPINYLTKGVPA